MGTRKSTDYTSFCETLEWWLNEAEGEATKDRVFFSKEKSRILVQKALEESREQGIDDLKLFTAIRTSYLIGCNMDSWMADYTKDAS